MLDVNFTLHGGLVVRSGSAAGSGSDCSIARSSRRMRLVAGAFLDAGGHV